RSPRIAKRATSNSPARAPRTAPTTHKATPSINIPAPADPCHRAPTANCTALGLGRAGRAPRGPAPPRARHGLPRSATVRHGLLRRTAGAAGGPPGTADRQTGGLTGGHTAGGAGGRQLAVGSRRSAGRDTPLEGTATSPATPLATSLAAPPPDTSLPSLHPSHPSQHFPFGISSQRVSNHPNRPPVRGRTVTWDARGPP